MVAINKDQIVRLYPIDKMLFWNTSYCDWRLSETKGSEIFYFFFRFGRKKYYDEDMYRQLFSRDTTLYTKEEMIERIKQEYNFDEYHLFEDGDDIYQKPNVMIELSNNKTITKYFDTIEECEQYINQLVSSNNNLIYI